MVDHPAPRLRPALLAALSLVAASAGAWVAPSVFSDGFESGDTCGWAADTPTCPGMHLSTPVVVVAPGESALYCYYFHASNAAPIAARRLASRFGPAVVDIVWFQTFDTAGDPADRQAPGTLSTVDCGFLGDVDSVARWAYSAHHPVEAVAMPADDGAGAAVAMEIAAGQPGFVQIFVSNGDVVPVSTSVQLDAVALPAATPYVATAGYFTYNSTFSVAPGGSLQTFTKTCAVPAATSFWWFSTRTHSHATEAKLEKVVSGTPTTILVTNDWADPAIQTYGPPGFFTFGATGTLRYSCSFINNSGGPVNPGNDPVTDENCVGLGYFFPATGPLTCLNDIGPL